MSRGAARDVRVEVAPGSIGVKFDPDYNGNAAVVKRFVTLPSGQDSPLKRHVSSGWVLIEINDTNVSKMKHKDVLRLIKSSLNHRRTLIFRESSVHYAQHDAKGGAARKTDTVNLDIEVTQFRLNRNGSKQFGEYEVFATDDDDRGEIVRIVRSDQIMGNEGRKKKNPSMGIVRKKLGKVPKAGKVAYQKKMKLPTGLINYMDYTIGEGHGLDQGDIDKIKTLAKALRDGGDLSQDVGLRKDAVRILSFLIKSNILQDKTKDLSKGKVDEKKKKKDDRCTRIAKRKYDTWPSAYASGAVVRCRKGEIWKKEK